MIEKEGSLTLLGRTQEIAGKTFMDLFMAAIPKGNTYFSTEKSIFGSLNTQLDEN